MTRNIKIDIPSQASVPAESTSEVCSKKPSTPDRIEGGFLTCEFASRSMNRSQPSISVITVVYNDKERIAKTIESVLKQTYDNIEYIIIDGGSTDGTVDIIRHYEARIAYWMSEPDKGISDAFNKGLSVMTGDWVVFLNSADTFARDDSLCGMSQYFDRAQIITGFARVGSKLLPKRMLENGESLLVRAMISHQATIVHRNIFNMYGGFDTDYKIRMDYDFWLRVLPHESFIFVEDIFVDFAEGGASAAQRKRYFLEELRANKKNLGRYYSLNLERIKFVLERYFRFSSKKVVSP